MKNKLAIFLMSLLAVPALAFNLTVVNKTPNRMRITELNNKCSGFIVDEKNPIHLKPNETVVFKDLIPVIHIYTMCGSGFCASSAMGFKDDKEYTLTVILDRDGIISGVQVPNIWPGNINCPGETK